MLCQDLNFENLPLNQPLIEDKFQQLLNGKFKSTQCQQKKKEVSLFEQELGRVGQFCQ